MEEKNKKVALKNNVGDQVIARLNTLCDNGFNMPADYNYVNAIKMTMLKLQEVKDKNGKSCFDVCTPQSIQTALYKMCCKGLNMALNQAYAIIRGNQLCIDESYFGKILMVKRIYPDWHPHPRVIREGDTFKFEIDQKKGINKLVEHTSSLENMDKDFIGGYMYIPCGNGELDLYVMTKKMILTAWSKSSSREQAVHKTFTDKMIKKTLVNTGCNIIINSTPELNDGEDSDDNETTETTINKAIDAQKDYADFEEVEYKEEEIEDIKEQPKEQPAQSNDDITEDEEEEF